MNSFKKLPVFVIAFAALLLFTGALSAFTLISPQTSCPSGNSNCCKDLSYEIVPDTQNVSPGVSAVYTITITNTGLAQKEIHASAECPSELSCEFSGLSFPTFLNPTESKIAHLYVYTTNAPSKQYSIPIELSGTYLGQTCVENTDAEGSQLALGLQVLPAEATPIPQLIAAELTPSEEQVAMPGDTVTYKLKLKNNAGKKAYVTISDSGNPFKKSTFYSYSTVNLESDESQTLTITLKVPPGTPGSHYNWTVLATSSLGATADVSIPMALQVYAKTLAVALLQAPYPFDCEKVETGDSDEIPLTIRNDGEVTGPFTFALEGSEGALAIASIDQDLIEVKAGEQADLKVSLAPAISTTLGQYSTTLVGRYYDYEFLRRTLCFEVTGYEEIKVIKPIQTTILRTETTSIPFTIINQGTLTEQIAFEWIPSSKLGFINVEPKVLNLTPGQQAKVNLVISTNMNTPLEDFVVPVLLRASKSNFSTNIHFNVSVISSNRSGESFLQILTSSLEAAEEGTTTSKVQVRNNGKQAYGKVTLAIDGIPAEWFTVDFPRPIEVNQTAEYTLTFTPPLSSSGSHPIKIYAFSGKESVKEDATLEVTPYLDSLKMAVTASTEKKEDGQVSSIVISMRVTNDGGNRLTNIAPVIFSDEVQQYNYASEPSTLSLGPGEQADVKFVLKPNKQTSAKLLPITLASTQGKSAPNEVGVPAMKAVPEGQNLPFPWKTMAIIALLVIILAIVAHEEREA